MKINYDHSRRSRFDIEDSFSAASLVEDAVYNATSYPHMNDGGAYHQREDGDVPSRDDDDFGPLFRPRRQGRRRGSKNTL